MVKRIVLFSDGTSNSSASPFKTNVWRVYDALDVSPGSDQVAFYDDGVGTSSNKYVAAVTAAIGIGLKQNVLDLYKFLSRQYSRALLDLKAPETGSIRQDDLPKISCFGFSRGAFTIRVLLGLIQSQGLLTHAGEEELDWFALRAYEKFREEAFHTIWGVEKGYRWWRNWRGPKQDIARGYAEPYCPGKNRQARGSKLLKQGDPEITIEFLGLWDTVGAYGMPFEEFRVAIQDWIFPLTFSGNNLCEFVDLSRHALSIDDERDAFTPIAFHDAPQRAEARRARKDLMDAHVSEDDAYAKVRERSVQLWFAGMHANVGGGYPDDSLAYQPLDWILREAVDCDAILCRPAALEEIKQKATAFGKMYDSRGGLDGLYRFKPRDVARALLPQGSAKRPEYVQDDDYLPLVHESAVDRIAAAYDGYAPIALPHKFGVADAKGRVTRIVDSSRGTGKRVQTLVSDLPQDAAVAMLNPPDEEQKRLVNTAVFWRRVVYQTAVLPALALAAIPLFVMWRPRDIDQTSLLGALFKLLGQLLDGVSFGLAHHLTDAFRAYPVWAFALLVVSMGSFCWGARLKSKIGDRSRKAWAIEDIQLRQSWLGKWLWDPLAEKITNCGALVRGWNAIVLGLIPLLIAFLVAVTIFVTLVYAALQVPGFIDRLAFQAFSISGHVCRGDAGKPLPLLEGKHSFTFDTANPCAPGGVALKEGARYRVTFEMQEKKWFDASHEADLAGLDWSALEFRNKAFYLAVTPSFRRVLTEPWFKPLLRIGEKWHNEIPVSPDVPFVDGAPHRNLTMTFKSPANGQLFVFVNDAYTAFFPSGWFSSNRSEGYVRHTYANNAGQARVTIESVQEQ
jgi:uncharacterized protein (DUF2235 family)